MQVHNFRAATFMLLAMAGYVFNDAFMKLLARDMSMGQAIFLRGLVASLMIGFLAHRAGALRTPGKAFRPMPMLRTAGEVLGTVLYLTALVHIPLANALSIMQATPLAVTLGATLFLGEKVGWRRWMAILLGFCGVLMVVQPGTEGYSSYALLACSAVVCAATRDLATRATHRDVPTLFLSAIMAPAVGLAGLAMWIYDGSVAPITITHVLLVVGASAFILIAYQGIALAMRQGEIGFVAPFRYTAILWSILLGILLFSEFPDQLTLVGSAIVVATGIYSLYRERRVANRS